MTKLILLIGTRKGAFILTAREGREDWTTAGPFCEGWPVNDMTADPATGSIYAGATSPWYGPAVFRTDDLGATWSHSSEGLGYGDDGPSMKAVWSVTPAGDRVYAGVEPAGLFRSDDRGQTWRHVEGLRDHPSRPDWQPGNGGLILHTIVPHPTDAARLWVGISAVGVFETTDDGATWSTRNKGVRAGFQPDEHPEFGQCVHKLIRAADGGDVLLQQNHCGVYRTEDGGANWQEITEGLPSEFGFPMAGHPREPGTAWVVPLNGADRGRYVPDAAAAVWRTRDGGGSWQRLAEGLPQQGAYLGILREAMATDRLDPVGVYFGTSTGQLYGSTDEGDRWRLIADHLPPIWSVDTLVVD